MEDRTGVVASLDGDVTPMGDQYLLNDCQSDSVTARFGSEKRDKNTV